MNERQQAMQKKNRRTYTISTCPLRVRDIPEHERPRELIDRVGVSAAPDHVLIAVLLRSGIQGTSVIQLAYSVLKQYGSLKDVALAPVEELARIRGMGKVRAQVLKAALELGQRIHDAESSVQQRISDPESAARLFHRCLRDRETESFWLILLDSRNKVIRQPVEISRGSLDASIVHPREVFRDAVKASSAAIVVAHNHPSGDTTPSAEDLKITRKLVEAGKIVDIGVLDHIILASNHDNNHLSFLSMREEGLVSF
jgi:DNA repair protein RadC